MQISDDVQALEKWDVVVLPFPYADRLAEKRRPGLVISSNQLAKERGLVWVAMITSARNAPWPDDVAVEDLELAGLPAPSVVRSVKIATVDVGRIVRVSGHIDEQVSRRVAAVLAKVIGTA